MQKLVSETYQQTFGRHELTYHESELITKSIHRQVENWWRNMQFQLVPLNWPNSPSIYNSQIDFTRYWTTTSNVDGVEAMQTSELEMKRKKCFFASPIFS